VSVGEGPEKELVVNSRVKTSATIVDKIRRGTRLSTMQDVMGFRVSAGPRNLTFTHRDQDTFADKLAHEFPARLVDRRVRPSAGYRALHAIVLVDGFPMEIQIRTTFEDLWANGTEALADNWGRRIRYGGPPGGTSEQVTRRLEALHANAIVSDRIYEFEIALNDVLRTVADTVNLLRLPTHEAEIEAARAYIEERLRQPGAALTEAVDDFEGVLSSALT